jgi:hypothetical protein
VDQAGDVPPSNLEAGTSASGDIALANAMSNALLLTTVPQSMPTDSQEPPIHHPEVSMEVDAGRIPDPVVQDTAAELRPISPPAAIRNNLIPDEEEEEVSAAPTIAPVAAIGEEEVPTAQTEIPDILPSEAEVQPQVEPPEPESTAPAPMKDAQAAVKAADVPVSDVEEDQSDLTALSDSESTGQDTPISALPPVLSSGELTQLSSSAESEGAASQPREVGAVEEPAEGRELEAGPSRKKTAQGRKASTAKGKGKQKKQKKTQMDPDLGKVILKRGQAFLESGTLGMLPKQLKITWVLRNYFA